MAQTGYTPILVYASGTATNVPLAINLTSSALGAELALNYADGKLYYKNSSGTVTLLASAAGSLGDVVGPASATDNALARFDLTTGKLIQNSVGILSDAGILTGLTGITSSGSITFSSLTSGRVTFASTGGLLADSADLTWNGTSLSVTGALSATGVVTGSNFNGGISGFSVGAGADGYQTGLQIFGSGGGGSAYRVNTLAQNVTVTSVTANGLGIGTTSPSTGKFSDASYALLNQSVSTSTGTNIFSSNSDNTKFIGLWSGHSGADSAIGVKSGTNFTFGAWAAINGVGGFTEWARLNSAGNYSVGGFTANAWGTGYRAINLFSPNSLGLAGSDYGSQVTNNCFAPTGGWERVGASYGAGRYEQFNGYHAWYGDDAGAAGAYTPTARMYLFSSGVLQFPATNFGAPQISNVYATSLANGATVDFSSFSGMILVSNWTIGSVGLWITGGGVVVLVSSVGSSFGAVTFVPGIDGYRFTNNTGSTLTFSFTAIRYRPNG
jgi:hypothetical protein